MNITINGTTKQITAGSNAHQLVSQFCKAPKNVIVEINGTIIHSNDWEKTLINEGDSIELVTFVGGG